MNNKIKSSSRVQQKTKNSMNKYFQNTFFFFVGSITALILFNTDLVLFSEDKFSSET